MVERTLTGNAIRTILAGIELEDLSACSSQMVLCACSKSSIIFLAMGISESMLAVNYAGRVLRFNNSIPVELSKEEINFEAADGVRLICRHANPRDFVR